MLWLLIGGCNERGRSYLASGCEQHDSRKELPKPKRREGDEAEGGEEAVSLRNLERFVESGLEKLDVWLVLGRPLMPALVAGQRHHKRAACGQDGLRNATAVGAGRANSVECSHRREGRTISDQTNGICTVLDRRECGFLEGKALVMNKRKRARKAAKKR